MCQHSRADLPLAHLDAQHMSCSLPMHFFGVYDSLTCMQWQRRARSGGGSKPDAAALIGVRQLARRTATLQAAYVVRSVLQKSPT
eukprot:CAMPEP_0179459762 /NCGR_PEP_ID=MMETSP0799-20121207/43028_1 /TAXON_ID=46947 /ORGANISM="Geminigera cryophila, Strain CCMP2564" /LENGTH=84 /DNA_ID=CAMNT_0021261769 /DNA_START=137 /DNA_END=391 /DNA_ORIENTATION=-